MSLAEKDSPIDTWVPSWVKTLGTAVWVTDPEGRIAFMNSRAEDLLGREAASCIGSPCHRIVSGCDELGRPFCATLCPMERRARLGQEIEPVRMRVSRNGVSQWIQVLAISVHDPLRDRPYLVHCVLDQNRVHRIEEYLTRVATRTKGNNRPESDARFHLTNREKEILALLVGDETLYGIADKLNVSHATVRNHVQHILAKLGVHSIMEAVAYYLLDDES